MTQTFSQQFCSVAPVSSGGRIVVGGRIRNCLVEINDGALTVIQAPATPVLKTPVAGLKIITPATLKKVGTGLILQAGNDGGLIDDRPLAVEFDMVYRREQDFKKKPSALARMFSLSDITDVRKSMRHGRQLTGEFTTALLSAGAVDTTR